MKTPLLILISLISAAWLHTASGGVPAGVNHRVQQVAAVKTDGTGTCVVEEAFFFNGFAIEQSNFSESLVPAVSVGFRQMQLLSAILHSTERQVALRLAHSVSQVCYFPVRIRKANLLFPFHYFF